jgi:SlyX protein
MSTAVDESAGKGSLSDQEARITELEIKLTYAEDLLEQLNLTVFRQQQRIDLLQQELRLLNNRMENLAASEEKSDLREEIPPHY